MYSLSDLRLDVSAAGAYLLQGFLSDLNRASRDLAGQPYDHETVVRLGENLITYVPDVLLKFDVPENLETDFMDITFKSPLVVAAFKGRYDVLRKWENLGASVITKTIMPYERPGNSRPRHTVFTDEFGHRHNINAYGLPSKGVEKEVILLENSGLLDTDSPLGVSFGCETPYDGICTFKKLLDSSKIKSAAKNRKLFGQGNLGCPNVKTGHEVCKIPGKFGDLMDGIINAGDDACVPHIPILFKMPAYIIGMDRDGSTNRILEIAGECAEYRDSGINVGMTLANTMPVDVANEDGYIATACCGLSTKRGGLSGERCKPLALELTRKVKEKYGELPVSYCGGIRGTSDVIDAQEAGAELFEAATSVGENMFVIPRINRGLSNYRLT